jgi:hypothetical protein
MSDPSPSQSNQDALSIDASTPQNLLGLKILHEPKDSNPNSKVVDIIFIHGLGGSSSDTWIHPSSKAFWPNFLHEEDRFANACILTFGYDSDLGNIFHANNVLDISAFTKQLLDHLDLHYEEYPCQPWKFAFAH